MSMTSWRLITVATAVFLVSCTKKVGIDPNLAYSDDALFDSCASVSATYYKDTLYSGQFGPHGPFKLRFNAMAMKALGPDGKLPAGVIFGNGSLLVKDVTGGSQGDLYALMYKRSGQWLWAEIKRNGEVLHSVTGNTGVCLGCHAGSGNRDKTLSPKFY
jgi:hypothetical protein